MAIEHILGLIISILSNALASFAGGGGSLVLMSGLILMMPSTSYLVILALVKTSAAVMTASSGTLHLNKQKLDWKMIATLFFPGLIGIIISTYLVQYKIEEGILISAIPFLLLGIVLYLIFNRRIGIEKNRTDVFTRMEYLEAGIFSFFLSVANGMIAGLGTLFVAYFVIRFRTSYIQTIAYMMISGAVINIVQATYLVWAVDLDLILLGMVILGSFFGSIVGTKLQYKMGNRFVKPAALSMMSGLSLLMVLS